MKTLDLIFQTYEELDNDQDMISPLQFGQLLVDWTDPSKIVGANEQQDFSSVHVHLAIDIVRALYDNERAGINIPSPLSYAVSLTIQFFFCP